MIDNSMMLLQAVKNNDVDLVSELLTKNDIDINHIDDDGNTALLCAIKNSVKNGMKNRMKNNSVGIVEMLLSMDNIDINCADAYGKTPLIVSVEYITDVCMTMVMRNTSDSVAECNGLTEYDERVVKNIFKNRNLDVNLADNDSSPICKMLVDHYIEYDYLNNDEYEYLNDDEYYDYCPWAMSIMISNIVENYNFGMIQKYKGKLINIFDLVIDGFESCTNVPNISNVISNAILNEIILYSNVNKLCPTNILSLYLDSKLCALMSDNEYYLMIGNWCVTLLNMIDIDINVVVDRFYGNTVIHGMLSYCVHNSYCINIMKNIIESNNFDVNKKNRMGESYLYLAAKYNVRSIVEILLKKSNISVDN